MKHTRKITQKNLLIIVILSCFFNQLPAMAAELNYAEQAAQQLLLETNTKSTRASSYDWEKILPTYNNDEDNLDKNHLIENQNAIISIEGDNVMLDETNPSTESPAQRYHRLYETIKVNLPSDNNIDYLGDLLKELDANPWSATDNSQPKLTDDPGNRENQGWTNNS